MRFIYCFIGIFFFLYGTSLQGQESAVSTGGEATGSGGSSSYSVGQVAYSTDSGSTGSAAQGVQVPYEIYTVLGIEKEEIQLNMSTYPNPTTDYLNLHITDKVLAGYSFSLVDLQGKLLMEGKVKDGRTTIDLTAKTKAIYFLKVFQQQTLVKTFKILKH